MSPFAPPLLLCAGLLAALAATLPVRADEPPVFDLNAQLEPICKRHQLPALAAVIITGERTEARGAVGVRQWGKDAPVTMNDQFHLGSCTKSMTATLIGLLVEQGKLRWETTIAEVFPEFAAKMKPAFRAVTIEQLLQHRGGVTGESWLHGTTFEQMHQLPGTPRQQRLAYVEKALQQAPEAPPGTKFIYSNMGYAIAGAMAERVMNDSWEHLMTERLFHPLHMTTAGFGAMGTPGKLDQPRQHLLAGETHQVIEPGPLSDNPSVIGPAGLVHCSLEDWGKYVRLHLQGEEGKDGLLKAKTLQHLHTPQFGGEYADGWGVTDRDWGGGRVWTHAGSNNQNYAVVWMAPKKDFAVLVCTNQGGEEAAKACDEAAAALILLHLQGMKP